MKKITMILAFGLITFIGNAQSYEWAKKIAGTSPFNVTTSDIIAAKNGDVYVCGKFTGTVDFDPNAATVNRAAQGTDGFVAAFNPAGELEWVYTTNVAGIEEIPAISFYSPGTAFHLTAVVKIGSTSFKLEKLNRITGLSSVTSSTYAASVALDIKEIDDRGYLVGGFTGTFDLGAGASPLDLTNAGLSDGFCIKLGGTSSAYSITETASYGGTGFDIINALSIDYLVGSFTGSITIGTATLTSDGGKDGLLFQFDPTTLASVNNFFVDSVGGTGDDEILSVYFDDTAGSNFVLYIGGYFSGTANFNLASGNSPLVSAGGTDGFTVSYSFNNSTNTWSTTQLIKHGGTADDQIVDIAMDNNISDRCYFVGNRGLAAGGSEVMLGSFRLGAVTTYSGNFTPTDATKLTKASAVAFTISNLFYAGEFNANTDFNIDNAVTSNLTFTTGGSNMFLQKSSFCTVSATAPTLIGASTLCSGSPITMYINDNATSGNINNNLNWKWYSSSCGGTLVGTGSSITVSPTATTTYYARGEDGCVAAGPCSAAKTVTVFAIPNNGVTLTGNTLTSSQVGNNATYQWIDCNNGNSDIAGATAQSYTPTVSGSYAVKVSNPGGCLVTSACTQVTLCTTASIPTVSGNNAVCNGQSITLSIATGTLNGSTTWRWYSGSCGGTLVGTGASITVSPTATTDYYVRGEGGCTANGTCSTVKTVTVNPIPNNAVTLSGNTLTATQSGATYQWVDCNNGNSNIAGATSQSYTPTVSGNYAVKITSAAGCLATSACTQLLSNNEFEQLGIKLYPNPIKNNFTIEGEIVIEKLAVYNLLGQKVKVFAVNESNYDISELASGTYIIEVLTDKGIARTKIIKE